MEKMQGKIFREKLSSMADRSVERKYLEVGKAEKDLTQG